MNMQTNLIYATSWIVLFSFMVTLVFSQGTQDDNMDSYVNSQGTQQDQNVNPLLYILAAILVMAYIIRRVLLVFHCCTWLYKKFTDNKSTSTTLASTVTTNHSLNKSQGIPPTIMGRQMSMDKGPNYTQISLHGNSTSMV